MKKMFQPGRKLFPRIFLAYFLLFRIYEQPLLLQPNPATIILEAHVHANPKPKVIILFFNFVLKVIRNR